MLLDQDNINAFLAELTELTKKHKIVIHGCGCCGSPSLYEMKDLEKDYDYKHLEAVAEPEIKFTGEEERVSTRLSNLGE